MTNEVEFTDDSFEREVIKSNMPVLVDFWAPWCAPCLIIGPIVQEIANEYKGKIKVGRVNTDESQQTAVRYGIMSIPTLMIFKDGEVRDRIVGLQPKDVIKGRIDEVLEG